MNIRRNLAPAGVAALGLLLAGCGHNTTAMAPPTSMMQPPGVVQPVSAPGSGQTTALSPGQYTPYNWASVPQNQQIPIVHATFDQGGYQLYDTSGDNIVVPFANRNLYVMQFGQSSNGQMYFVNTGTTPVLYVPPGGYLENASVQGAHWYPFSQNFAYTGQPVYVGPAPTWDAFTGMGWYPGMMYYGGYYGYHPWGFGSPFLPMVGLNFLIGGHPYYGWNSYHTYYNSHPGYVRTTYNPNIYHSASLGRTGSFGGGRTFGRTGTFSGGRTGSFSGGTRPFGTATGSFSGSRPLGSAAARPSGSFGSAPRAFGGGTRTGTGSFGGGAAGYGGSFGRTGGFNSRPFGGGAPAARPSFGGGSFGNRPSFGGGSFGSRPSSGGGSFGSRPSFGGGSFGGGRSSGGGSFGGGRSFGGGFGGRRR